MKSSLLYIITILACLSFAGQKALALNTITTEPSWVGADSTEAKSVTVKITGMHCGGCSWGIHNALTEVKGFISDDISYPGDISTIKYDPEKTSEQKIIKAIKKTGYGVTKVDEEESRPASK